nr:MAG TPA: hypothetical protein [Caudoviricetes sp.]
MTACIGTLLPCLTGSPAPVGTGTPGTPPSSGG